MITYLQGAPGAPASANGNGTAFGGEGFDSVMNLEIVETGGGTCTVTIEGAFDGNFTNAYTVGYQQINGVASPTRSVSAISVGANSAKVYQILDPYPQIRARISSVAGGASVAVRGYMVQ